MTEFDSLKALQHAGVLAPAPEGHLDEEHKAYPARQVLSSLTPAEVAVLTSVRDRLTAAGAGADVESHMVEVTGGVLW
jgi:hypothetical protein